MKKLLYPIIIALAIAFTTMPASADEIKDITPGHWAYKSVKYLVDKGYLALYEDGTFRGDLPVNRVVFATALKKLVDQIRSGEISPNTADMKEIQKLLDAYKREISDSGNRIGSIDKQLENQDNKITVIQQDLTKTLVEVRDDFKKMSQENNKQFEAMRAEMKANNEQLVAEVNKLSKDLEKEKKQRKSAQTTLWIGVGVAAIAALASN